MNVRQALRAFAHPEREAGLQKYLRTCDPFLGCFVPDVRGVAKQFAKLQLSEVESLLESRIHEERLLALFILCGQYKGCPDECYHFYMRLKGYVDNWDLVDSSAYQIAGAYLESDPTPLLELATAKRMWDRRIAMVATFHSIRLKRMEIALQIARMLLNDSEDLIHKASGWMLREVGKRDRAALERFLDEHAKLMPRTMLRYAIEHYSKERRAEWMQR